MNWQRLSTLAFALSFTMLACGGDDGMIAIDDADGGAGTGPGNSTPTDVDGDGIEDVPPTDEELQYGDEGDEEITDEVLAEGERNTAGGFATPTAAQFTAAAANHPNVDKNNVIPSGLKQSALAYYDANPGKFQSDYMGIIDMGKHSKEERFFIIDLKTGAVEKTVVAHGSGSDPSNTGTPTRFSNVNNSKMSSLGFYKTGETYTSGKVGFALRLDGLQATNSAARARGVVLHASSYVSRGRAKQGRSWGCPAVPTSENRGIIAKLKGGRLLLIEKGGNAVDGCGGKSDGWYCSDENKASAYNCRGGARSGVTNCSDTTKTCKAGSDRKASVSGSTLSCQ